MLSRISIVSHRIRSLKILRYSQLGFKQNLLSLANFESTYLTKNNHVPRYRYLTNVATHEKSSAYMTRDSSKKDNFYDQDLEHALSEIDLIIRNTGRIASKHVSYAFSLIQDFHDSASSTHGLYLLRSCNFILNEPPNERVALANNIWKKVQELGGTDVNHFNSLLKIYVDNNHEFSPSEFLNEMEKRGQSANKMTYLMFMQKYCNDGNLVGASEILQFLKDKELSINENVFNILIKGHLRAKDINGAKSLLNVMRSANLSPGADSYTILACGEIENGNVQELKILLSEAKDNNVILTNEDYLLLISSFSNVNNIKGIDEVLSMMTNIQDFKHDFVNLFINAIHKNSFDIAFKLLLSIPTAGQREANLFIRQLIKNQIATTEDVIKYCEEIDGRSLSDNVFSVATKVALENEKFDHVFKLFEILQSRGIPVRMSHFQSILLHFRNSEKDILKVLKKMSELGFLADFRTFNDFIFPAMLVDNPENVISHIRNSGHSLTAAIDPLFEYYLNHGQMDNALHLIQHHDVKVHPHFDLEHFFQLWSEKFKNSMSYIKVSHFLLKNLGSFRNENEVAVGKNIAKLLFISPSIFKAFQSRPDQFNFSKESMEVCWNILKANRPELLEHIRKFKVMSTFEIPQTIELEEKELNALKLNGSPSYHYLMDLLTHHIKQKNIARVNEIRKHLEDDKTYQIGPLAYAQFFSFFVEIGDIENAKHYLSILKEQFPTFKIDAMRIIDYATILLKMSKHEEMDNLIKNDLKDFNVIGSIDAIAKSIKKLFVAAIETGNMDLIKDLQNCLMCHASLSDVKDIFYEPLIKLYLFRNELSNAINELNRCVTQHKIVPCINLLLKKCIINDDHSALENVIDLASSVIRKHNILHELVLAFLETGRRTQALKVLENLGTKVNSAYLESICQKLYNQNRMLELEELFWISSGVEHVDKNALCSHVFKLLDEKNNFSKALEIYSTIEKEKLFILSEKNKQILSNLFKRNNQTVSFTVHDEKYMLNSSNETDVSVREFLNHLKKGAVIDALDQINNMSKGQLRLLGASDISNFIQLLLHNNCINAVSDNAYFMSFIIEHPTSLIKPLLQELSEAGDIESLTSLGNLLPDFTRKSLSFNTFWSRAYIKCGKYEELLSQLEQSSDSKNRIFSIGTYLELLKQPTLEKRAIELAEKYKHNYFDLPIACVWVHYLACDEHTKADELLKSHSVPVDQIDITVLRIVQESENIGMGMKYISEVNKQNSRNRCKERAYGTVIDLLVSKEKLDEAVALVLEAKKKDVNLEKYFRSTLINLKKSLEAAKKDIPFSIL